MKRCCFILLTVALLIMSCGGSTPFGNKSIDLVKKSPWPGGDGTTTVDSLMKQIVGLRGKVECAALKDEGEKDSRIEVVQIDLTNSEGKEAFVQFHINTELGTFQLSAIMIEGEVENLALGGWKLGIWGMGNAMKDFKSGTSAQ